MSKKYEILWLHQNDKLIKVGV